jgi:hypothetical protein
MESKLYIAYVPSKLIECPYNIYVVEVNPEELPAILRIL